jgi:hypothetical protein
MIIGSTIVLKPFTTLPRSLSRTSHDVQCLGFNLAFNIAFESLPPLPPLPRQLLRLLGLLPCRRRGRFLRGGGISEVDHAEVGRSSERNDSRKCEAKSEVRERSQLGGARTADRRVAWSKELKHTF